MKLKENQTQQKKKKKKPKGYCKQLLKAEGLKMIVLK